jgi:hypothetical protein
MKFPDAALLTDLRIASILRNWAPRGSGRSGRVLRTSDVRIPGK